MLLVGVAGPEVFAEEATEEALEDALEDVAPGDTTVRGMAA